MCLKIHNEAIFIADSHFNKKNEQFYIFLQQLKSKNIKTTQLFLMGDMFDFLSDEIAYFKQQNQKVIDILNDLSTEMQIVYLEGNHDYNLKNIFSNIQVVKLEEQPLKASLDNKTVLLSHGDNFLDWKYNTFCKVIRNSFILNMINLLDVNNFISSRVDKMLVKKNICHKIDNYESLVKRRVKNYNSDIIIEGHYHQGSLFELDNKLYKNIPSLCCQEEFVILKDGKFVTKKLLT